jgi:predicted metal-binding membrane protein
VASTSFLAIWTAMMAVMMLPSTVPLLRLDHAAARSQTRLVAIAAGYLLVWVAASVAAARRSGACCTGGATAFPAPREWA